MDEQPALEYCVGPAVPVTVCNLERSEVSKGRAVILWTYSPELAVYVPRTAALFRQSQ